jgi:hypothetical protein
MARIEFTGKLVAEGPGGAWTFLHMPEHVTAHLGTKAMVQVMGSMNGTPFRTSLAPSGKGTHVMTVNRELQAAAGARPGDTVTIALELDSGPRLFSVPGDVTAALEASSAAAALWEDLTPRAREEWVEWVESAKKAETRQRRIEQLVERLESGKRRVYQ